MIPMKFLRLYCKHSIDHCLYLIHVAPLNWSSTPKSCSYEDLPPQVGSYEYIPPQVGSYEDVPGRDLHMIRFANKADLGDAVRVFTQARQWIFTVRLLFAEGLLLRLGTAVAVCVCVWYTGNLSLLETKNLLSRQTII